jgi:predicted Rossmann fold nucleotide-binding protein DprA/Smf involved in DNA uptake
LVYTYIGIYRKRGDYDMKLLVVGSRSIGAFDLSPYIPKEVVAVISGGANGIDHLAEQYADQHRLSKYIIRPRYEKYGRAAPIKRNEEMVELADAVLVVWDGHSKGTQYTLQYAKKRNKQVTLVQFEG